MTNVSIRTFGQRPNTERVVSLWVFLRVLWESHSDWLESNSVSRRRNGAQECAGCGCRCYLPSVCVCAAVCLDKGATCDHLKLGGAPWSSSIFWTKDKHFIVKTGVTRNRQTGQKADRLQAADNWTRLKWSHLHFTVSKVSFQDRLHSTLWPPSSSRFCFFCSPSITSSCVSWVSTANNDAPRQTEIDPPVQKISTGVFSGSLDSLFLFASWSIAAWGRRRAAR